MALTITFLSFQKKVNSTKKPTEAQLAAGVKYENVTLKSLTNIDNPVLYLEGADINLWAYNYAYIHDWGRYYFVKTCSLRHETIFECHLELDDLATFKTQILAASAFVKYSTTNYNPLLKDDRMAILAKTEVDHQLEPSGIFFASDDEPILMTVVNDRGGYITYILDYDDYSNIFNMFMDAADSILDSLILRFGDAIKSVISIRRTPIIPSAMYEETGGGGHITAPVVLGTYEVDPSASWVPVVLESAHLTETIEIAIPWHYTDFRKQEPYTYLSLALPFIGEIPLHVSDFIDSDTIKIRTDVDCRTGVVVYMVYSYLVTEPVATYTAQIGADLPIATEQLSAGLNYVSSAIQVAKGAAAIATAEANPVAMASLISGAAEAITAFNSHSTERTGSFTGGYPEFGNNDYIAIVRWHETVNEPSNLVTLYGRPCGKVLSMLNLSDYVETRGFSISLNANKDVIDSINAKLDNGIYIQ